MKRIAIVVLTLGLAAVPLAAATFTVDSTGDEPDMNTADGVCETAAGTCTLRAAIQQSNVSAGADAIEFNIAGAGVHTIQPATQFPVITQELTIDGYTQPGAAENTDPVATNAVLLIELDGSAAGNPASGLSVFGGPMAVRGLVINRFSTAGISMGGNAAFHDVRGCFIGTDPSGTVALGNYYGIDFSNGTNFTIGGSAPADRNLIAGSETAGVHGGNFVSGVLEVIGNLVGTDASGQAALPNDTGVVVRWAPYTISANVISGNRTVALLLEAPGSVVQANQIGTTADGSGPLGNGNDGIRSFSRSNTIGGIGPGEANEIAYNGYRGFVMGTGGGGGVSNVIRGNSIHDNGELGIDLGADGPSANDAGDADTGGGNDRQNFPVLQSVEHLGPQGNGSTRIVGKLGSAASTTYDLDFYSNSACSNFPREFAEGETWLGTTQVTTDGNGNATFDVTLPVATEVGARITATATDPAGNTSEFSQRIVFSILPVSGPAAGGMAVTIKGTDFAGPATVTIGGAAPSGVSVVDSATITASSPVLAPGTSNDVVVTTPDGTTGTLIKGWVSDFLDVPDAHIFHDFVVTLVSNGITVGVGGGLYGVDQGTKRQQMAVFLLRAKYGLCYVPPQCSGTFPDVACPSLFADWIEALAAEGITTGCGGGFFCPDNLVTRRQMAVFLLKTKYGSTYVPPTCTGVFDDVACPGGGAVDFIERLAAEQITGGCSVMPPLYCPDNSSTRGQMAVFIVKTFSLQ